MSSGAQRAESPEELDPRIQLELEKLNTETAEINKLELELEESNTTFRMLLNEATRRLKCLAQRLGTSVERARPYHEAYVVAQEARTACQRAAVAYRHASEIHAAAKETVTLAEQRFKSNQHEWQFDNAWQEMLNHATLKVMDAENKKAESGREHQKRAQLFNTAETKLQHLEEQLRKHIIKSRPYFDEKQLCQEQLNTQKERIEDLQNLITKAKCRYSQSLKTLESISEEIHLKRGDTYEEPLEYPVGPREPGVGAENYSDFSLELERHDLGMKSRDSEADDMNEETKTLEELRRRVRRLAARPVEGGASGDIAWETELNETVNQLDQMLMLREKAQQAKSKGSPRNASSEEISKKSSEENLPGLNVAEFEKATTDGCDGDSREKCSNVEQQSMRKSNENIVQDTISSDIVKTVSNDAMPRVLDESKLVDSKEIDVIAKDIVPSTPELTSPELPASKSSHLIDLPENSAPCNVSSPTIADKEFKNSSNNDADSDDKLNDTQSENIIE